METLINKVNGFCKTFEGNLILNGDDPNTARLGRANPRNKNVKYFHADRYKFATEKRYLRHSDGQQSVLSGGEPLEYEYYQYSHIGKFRCGKCGFGHDQPDRTASGIDLDKPVFTADGHTYSPKLNSIYNVYNMTAVAAVAKLYGIDLRITDSVISNRSVQNGRMESFPRSATRKTTLNLARKILLERT